MIRVGQQVSSEQHRMLQNCRRRNCAGIERSQHRQTLDVANRATDLHRGPEKVRIVRQVRIQGHNDAADCADSGREHFNLFRSNALGAITLNNAAMARVDVPNDAGLNAMKVIINSVAHSLGSFNNRLESDRASWKPPGRRDRVRNSDES